MCREWLIVILCGELMQKLERRSVCILNPAGQTHLAMHRSRIVMTPARTPTERTVAFGAVDDNSEIGRLAKGASGRVHDGHVVLHKLQPIQRQRSLCVADTFD